MNGVGAAFNFDGKGCIWVGPVVLSWLWHFHPTDDGMPTNSLDVGPASPGTGGSLK
jgi:hypothetical protein